MAELVSESAKFQQAQQNNGFNYDYAVATKLSKIHAVRSVLYKKSDAIIAFRIVRVESDGGSFSCLLTLNLHFCRT